LAIANLGKYDPKIANHALTILKQIEKEPSRFGVGEAEVTRGGKDRKGWYPPNAFHTFWALEVLHCFKKHHGSEYNQFVVNHDIPRIIDGMLLWSRRTVGQQVALHYAESSVLDSDQLAWALATCLKFDAFPIELVEQDLLRAALKCLFGTQLSIGTWRHYRSLFHYKLAGNAYCYVFETLAALLKVALNDDRDQQFLRDALRPYVSNLIRLWRYAESTRVPLVSSSDVGWGWCSGHRLNQTKPESWATASVFAFAQALRRLIGVWSRESAREGLNVVIPSFKRSPKEILAERGNSWSVGGASAVEQLYTMFINPVRKNGRGVAFEPDIEPLQEEQARSAILFGPPGTSKTTLCRALAADIGWKYIEVHANQFVSDGMDNIHARADEIFRRLMELDHSVVLFDEIDELVREREGGQEAFGRFLTTSMLPKLAELWEQRKVIYFVATNYIKDFDRAITRSRRFDALILVGPTAYDAKVNRLISILSELGEMASMRVSAEDVWNALKLGGQGEATDPLPEDARLAKFLLLRWDQIEELAVRLIKVADGRQISDITAELLASALKLIGDRNLSLRRPYIEFLSDTSYPRRDYDKYLVWEIEGIETTAARESKRLEVDSDGRIWLTLRYIDDAPSVVEDRKLLGKEAGILRYG
jgi:shikimate kinase